MAKLTKAQMELLQSLPAKCVDYYPPRKKLIDLGLAEPGPKGVLVATPAGRQALSGAKP